jgi:hypothetical protein
MDFKARRHLPVLPLIWEASAEAASTAVVSKLNCWADIVLNQLPILIWVTIVRFVQDCLSR